MASIQTYVFVHFGCKKDDSKSLTELSLLAVNRSQFLQPEVIQEPPAKILLDLRSSGFDLYTFIVIEKFINDQQKPVCLISHNGHRYDFGILKGALKMLNVSLSDDILCADSIYIFYDILKNDPRNVVHMKIETDDDISQEQDPNASAEKSTTVDVKSDQTADYMEVEDSTGNELKDLEVNMPIEKIPENKRLDDDKKPIENMIQKLDPQNLEKTGRNMNSNVSYIYTGKALRTFFFDGYDTPRRGYNTLPAIYNREIEDPYVEDFDGAAMKVYCAFRVSHKLGERFLAWTDQIQYKFSDVVANDDIIFET